jgi:hypothetical protein
MRRSIVSAVVLCAALARAEDPPPLGTEAAAHLERGVRLYETQAYSEAIVEFRAGYLVDPQPVFLYNIAQAERLRGNCKEAVLAYRTYLRTEPLEERRAVVESHIRTCVAMLSRPPERPAPPAAAPPPAPPEHEPWYRDGVGNLLLGAGVAATASGGVLLALAHRRADAAEGAQTFNSFEGRRDAALRYRTASYVAFGVGGALAAAGVLRYALADRRSSALSFSPVPSGGALVWTVELP